MFCGDGIGCSARNSQKTREASSELCDLATGRPVAFFFVGVENASLSMVPAMNHFLPLTAMPAVLYSKLQHGAGDRHFRSPLPERKGR
jgi:hypothetical protein